MSGFEPQISTALPTEPHHHCPMWRIICVKRNCPVIHNFVNDFNYFIDFSVHAPAQGRDAHGQDLVGQRHPRPGVLAAVLPCWPLRGRERACRGRHRRS